MNLTEEEKAILSDLSSAWDRFISLENHCSWDKQEFTNAIHAAQSIIATRVARRCDKDIWIQPEKENPPPKDRTPEEIQAWMDHLYNECKKDEEKIKNILEKKSQKRRENLLKIKKEQKEKIETEYSNIYAEKNKLNGEWNFKTSYPSYCCQQCGVMIGWLGRFIEWIPGFPRHNCKGMTND